MGVLKKLLAVLLITILVLWTPELGEVCPFLGSADTVGVKMLITEGIICLSAIAIYAVWMFNKLHVPFWLSYIKLLLLILAIMPFFNGGFNISSTQFFAVMTLVAMFVTDAVVRYKRHGIKEADVKDVLVRDYPVGKDDYFRRSHARRLVEAIVADSQKPAEDIKGAYTINIDEKYGQGKSSYMILMESVLTEYDCIYFYFRPWRNVSPGGVTSSFFKQLASVLAPYIFYKEQTTLHKYAKTVVEFVEKEIGLPKLPVERFADKSQERYFEDISSLLRDRLKRPIVVLIDDVDRLKSEELWAVLSLIRNTADFPYLYYVMAADKNYIVSTLSKDLGGKDDVDFFLQKIITLNVLFPSVDQKKLEAEFKRMMAKAFGDFGIENAEIEAIYDKINKQGVFSHVNLLDVFTNFRSINRFFSMLRLDMSAYRPEMFEQNLWMTDFVMLDLVKYLRPDIFKILRDNPLVMLDVVGSSHRYVLNDESKELVQAESVKAIQEVLEKDDEKKKAMKRHLKDLMDAKRDRQELVNLYVYELMSDMFADRLNYQEERSIRRWNNFDWYFTAEEHSDMMSFTQFLEVFMAEEGVKGKFETVIAKGKENAFYQNLRQLYQHPDSLKSDEDKLNCLERTFGCVELSADEFQKKAREIPVSRFYAIEWTFDQYLEASCFSLLSKYKSQTIVSNKFVKWMKSCNVGLYAKILLMNQLMVYREHGVMSNKEIGEMYKDICAAIVMHLSAMENPYSREGIDLIGFCNSHFDTYWHECLINYYNGLDEEMLKRWMLLCIHWNPHQNCFETLSDVITKLFGYSKFFDEITLIERNTDLKILCKFLTGGLNINTATVEEYPILERVGSKAD